MLMELTPVRLRPSRKVPSLNSSFTSAWQSSKVPSIARLCTFGSVAVVIWRR
jgi:hypothetical protein